jgi:PAS domain S-box-containing protein
MGHSTEGSEKKRLLSELFSRPESLPVLLFLLLFVILYAAGPDLRSSKYVFDAHWLLFALNAFFITGLGLLIAGLCFRSYLRGGFLNVLMLGCGVLIFALSSFAAGLLIRPSYDPNDLVTIHNVGVLCMAILYFLSCLFTAIGFSMEVEHRRGLIAIATYCAVFVSGAVLAAETVGRFLPPFFVIGEGPTVTRQVVLAVSVTLLITSAMLMIAVYRERKTGFLLYSINALLLLGAGVVGVALGTPGSPLSWLGRAAQYLGNVYLVVASMQALAEARSRGTTVERALTDFFRKSETHYKALVEMAADSIIAIDRKGKIILMNPAAENTFGYGREEAAGQSLAEQIVPEQSRDSFHACLSGESRKDVEMELKRKDGSIFPAELSFSPEMKSGGGSERTIIIRDVTERKKAEEAVRSAALFPTQNPEPVLRIHRDGTLLFSNPAAEPVLKEWRAASVTEFPAQVRQTVEAALHEGESREFEIRIAGRDFSFVAAPIVEGQYANLYGWDVTESKRAGAALQESEERYRRLFESMNEGFALHELLYDESGEPCDYRFLDINPAFERQTGLKRQDVIGRTVSEVLPDIESLWIKRYGEVALSGTPAHFESHSSALGRSYEIFAYRPAPGQFAGIFLDVTARRQAEDSLQASYDLLKIAQRAANAGIWRWDISQGKLTWSEEFYTLFALDPRATPSFDTWLGVLHPDDRQPAMERINRSVREGTLLENEYRIIRPDGRQRWIRAWGRTFYDENVQPLSMSGICIDATESKRAEEALRASELRMKAVADNLPVGVWFADETGRIIYGNEAGRRIWAGAQYIAPEEFHVYRAWWADTGKPLGHEDWAVSRALRKGETSLKEVLEIECFDGTRKIILNSAVPLKSADNSLLGVVVLNEDITERIAAEQAMRRSEARYRSYIEVTGQMGWTTNADGEVVDDVPALRQYTGQSFDEMRGWGWSKALHPYDHEITLAVWRKAVEEKQGYETEYRLRRHDGVYRYFLARGVPVLQDDGSVREWVGTCIDITERSQAQQALKISEEALRLANEELEQRVRERTTELILLLEDLEKSRDDLRKLASELVLAEERERKKIAVALHDEVAQTLAAARMRIDLLRSKPGDDDSRRALDEAQQLLVQAIRETRSLMTDISNPVLYDMGLQVAVQSLTEEVKARNGVSFSNSFTGSLRKLDQDMEVMIFQVVKELVQNIVKHSGARKASIRIVEERDDIKVVVADDGLGFDVGSVGAVGMDGGFGLFSIRERVKSYHGKIQIESEPGKGSEVTVMLPKRAAGVAASRKTRSRKGKV